jgi:hypothetical protein
MRRNPGETPHADDPSWLVAGQVAGGSAKGIGSV